MIQDNANQGQYFTEKFAIHWDFYKNNDSHMYWSKHVPLCTAPPAWWNSWRGCVEDARNQTGSFSASRTQQLWVSNKNQGTYQTKHMHQHWPNILGVGAHRGTLGNSDIDAWDNYCTSGLERNRNPSLAFGQLHFRSTCLSKLRVQSTVDYQALLHAFRVSKEVTMQLLHHTLWIVL